MDWLYCQLHSSLIGRVLLWEQITQNQASQLVDSLAAGLQLLTFPTQIHHMPLSL